MTQAVRKGVIGAPEINRRADRTSFSRQTVIHLWPAAEAPAAVPVVIANFSPVGVGLVCDAPLERGQQFTMRVSPAEGFAADLLYSVVYCLPDNGKFRIGSEFTCVAADADFQELPTDLSATVDRIRKAVLG